MAIVAYWHKSSNFGDNLTKYIIEKITGETCLFSEANSKDKKYVLAGSILNTEGLSNSIILGAGFASKSDNYTGKNNEIIAVRGILSLLNLLSSDSEDVINSEDRDEPIDICEPGLCLSKIYKPKKSTKKVLGIVPHLVDYEKVIDKYGDNRNVKVINLRTHSKKDLEKIIDDIYSCEYIISSSLHGLVVAHSYKIPSLWVEFSNNVIGNGFKFIDFLTSNNLSPVWLSLRNKIFKLNEHKNKFQTISSLEINKSYKVIKKELSKHVRSR